MSSHDNDDRLHEQADGNQRLLAYQISQLEKRFGEWVREMREGFDKLDRKLDERFSGRDARLDDHDDALEAHGTRLTILEEWKDAQAEEDLPSRVKGNEIKIGLIVFVFSVVGTLAAATLWGIPFGG